MSTKTPRLALGFDFGTANSATSICDGVKCQAIESQIDGSQIPTIVYAKGNAVHVGAEALMRSYDDTGDNLFMHAKRNLFERPREKIYGGRFTPIEVVTMNLRFVKDVALAARPDLRDYSQFGGKKRSADELGLIFTTPANWGVEQHDAYREAILAAGISEFDGFIAEPIAAARRVAHLSSVSLNDGNKILVVDIGAGTTDIAVLEYERGVFHQVAAASGDEYFAGHDFTNALAHDIAKKFRVGWQGVYDKGGLNLSGVSPKRRPQIVACWNAAEDTKKKYSILEEFTAVLDFPKGRKTHTIHASHVAELFSPLLGKFRDCVSKALDGTDLSFSEIDHPMLVGGSSRLPGLREAMAEVMNRDPSEIHVCTDSEHIVSGGAAEHGVFQEEASQALENGLGFVVFDPVLNAHRNVLMVSPGQIIQSDGLYVQRSDFAIRTANGSDKLLCRPFVCKTGVRAAVVDARDTFLEDSETVRLTPVEALLAEFPSGEHAVSVGVKVDPNRNLWMLIRPLGLEVEPLSISLEMAHETARIDTVDALTVFLLLDVSSSMRADDKIGKLREGARQFSSTAIERGATVGIIPFPGEGILCPPCRKSRRLHQSIDELQASGSTPMEQAFSHAVEACRAHASRKQQKVAIMFSDGHPNDQDRATAAANAWKLGSRLITVGIGDDVDGAYLRSLASDPSDYFFAKCPDNILQAFHSVAQLLWTKDGSSDLDDAGLDYEEENWEEDDESTETQEEEDWDDIEEDLN